MVAVDAVGSAQACLERIRSDAVDIVVTDVQMPVMSGVELCAVLQERHPDVLSIVLTGLGDLDTAVAAIRAGAYDFLLKPVKSDLLEVAIRRAADHINVKREVKRLRATADRNEPIEGIAGTSLAVREMTALIRQVADSDATVLITGESGTGKELVARALHELATCASSRTVSNAPSPSAAELRSPWAICRRRCNTISHIGSSFR